MENKFTCINCCVAFSDATIQRQHYKSDWHRYNLKRKVAGLPPVSTEEFQRRVILQRAQDEEDEKNNSVYCKVCHKTFSSSQSNENHLKSKKHKTLVENLLLERSRLYVSDPEHDSLSVSEQVKKKSNDKKYSKFCESDQEDVDSDDDIDSDEWIEELSDNNPILKNNCLFCSHHSATMMRNLKHMTIEHSFFIPDMEYVIDIKGLLCYLGEKIVQGCLCIWCNDRGREFHSSEAAQQHMIDKGHCKMLHEGETLLEYSEYYDYSSSYPDDYSECGESSDGYGYTPIIQNEDYQLVLPSGSVVGHRSLMRYYRQNFAPKQNTVACQKKVQHVIAKYKALGWTETDKYVVAKKIRDLRFMKLIQSKYYMKLGVKANKLNVKRPQVNF